MLECYIFISGRVLDRGGFGHLDRAFPDRDFPYQDFPLRDCLDLGYSALPDRYFVRYPFFDFVLSVAAAVIVMECKSN